jgi:hypothetical protein
VRHRLLGVLTLLSLLLCVALGAAWARSYWHGDRVDAVVMGSAYLRTSTWMFALFSGKGGVGVSEAHSAYAYDDEASWRRVVESEPTWGRMSHRPFPAVYPRWTPGEREWSGAGFQWTRIERLGADSWSIQRSVVVPYWLPCLLAGLAPAAWGRARLVRSRRARRGLCLSCGYDLTGNASGTCPECGVPAPRRENAA